MFKVVKQLIEKVLVEQLYLFSAFGFFVQRCCSCCLSCSKSSPCCPSWNFPGCSFSLFFEASQVWTSAVAASLARGLQKKAVLLETINPGWTAFELKEKGISFCKKVFYLTYTNIKITNYLLDFFGPIVNFGRLAVKRVLALFEVCFSRCYYYSFLKFDLGCSSYLRWQTCDSWKLSAFFFSSRLQCPPCVDWDEKHCLWHHRWTTLT